MKLRRSLASAAATAVLAPVALLTLSTGAYAEETPAPSDAVTATTATTTVAATPAPTDTTTAPESTAPETTTPPPTTTTAPTSTAPTTTTAPPTGTTPSAETAPPADSPVECEDTDDYLEDPNLTTDISGLPSKIVAGSGWHGFQLDVANSSGTSYKRVDLGVFAAQVDSAYNVSTSHLKLQLKDPDTGTWENISLDENDEGAGYVGYTDVAPHESFSVDLRLNVDASAPAGLGFAVSVGLYANDKGECVYSGDEDYYQFEVLAAGSKPGDVPPADPKPQGGNKPVPVKPAGDKEINPVGNLAETGSSSALPVIAMIGGVAMVVGAGALFVVRRRKSGADTGTAA